MKNHRPAILRIIIFCLTLLAFARLSVCDFSWWDDEDTIHQNTRMKPPTWNTLGFYWTTADEHKTFGLYVPVTYTVWSGLALIAHRDHPDAEGFTLNAWVFHSANILLHACTAVMAFQLLFRLLGSDIAAAMGALLFALHPVQVESVGWISGTKDLLCGLFSICSLLFYVRSTQLKSNDPHQRWPSRWRYLLGLLFFIFAMLSKPTGVVMPLMAGVIDLLLLNRSWKQTIKSLAPWLIMMIPCLMWTKHAQPAEWASSLSIWTRPAVAADAIAFYFYKLVWPAHLCLDYGRNPKAIVANHQIYFTWILTVIVTVFFWWKYQKHRPALAGFLLFLIPLLPILGFVPFEFQMISTTSDHYLYLSMMGVGFLFAWAMIRFEISSWICLLILLCLGFRSILQEPVWQNTRTLFLHNLDVNPCSVQACDQLGFITGRDARQLSGAGQPEQARTLFDQSISWYQRSLTLEPDSVPSMFNLALDYQQIGRTDLGLQLIHRMVQVQPNIPMGLRSDPITLAHLLVRFGDIHGAVALLDEAISQDLGNRDAATARQQLIQHSAANHLHY